MDRETVITHLQIIHTWAGFARDCDLQFFTAKHLEDIAKWSDDAIALLKQEAVKPKSKVRYSEDIMDSLVNLMTEFLEDHEIYMLMELVASAVATK